MKKIFLMSTLLVVISSASFAQVRYGVQVGGAMSFSHTDDKGFDDLSNKPRLGLVAGFLADIPLGPVSLRPELNFIQKGYRNDGTFSENQTVNGTTTTTNFRDIDKVRLNYLELPLNFVYNAKAGAGRIFFGLGPNFALGLSGKDEIEEKATTGTTLVTTKTTEDVKFSGDASTSTTGVQINYFKRFDFGGNVLAGYQFGMGLSVGVQFTLGLTDISRNQSAVVNGVTVANDDFSQKNHTLSLKFGYLFGGAKTSTGMSKTNSTNTGTSANF